MNYFNELYLYQNGTIKFFDKHDFLIIQFGSTGSGFYNCYSIPDENCSHFIAMYKNNNFTYSQQKSFHVGYGHSDFEIFHDESKLHEKYGKPTDVRPHYAHEGVRHMDDDQLCEYLRDWILSLRH